ncbi:hypothetical protein [Mycolicibacterium sp.]|uniref:hypothetical protein n=1 Tax=Mycolicibacterium sp. TaxID=2320850 RepID=UPI0037C5D2D2
MRLISVDECAEDLDKPGLAAWGEGVLRSGAELVAAAARDGVGDATELVPCVKFRLGS